ncbi:hypothetical protein K466DRAFT_269014 [Polyporus arcularius HHB13444]|uniref:Uncharacterized protein n=1 Tax=Polyporus arcularius HHB13444 TaxID=1314778 RepID=A0A5C3P1T8_9APHY|nr:hypothetical protein K466DRAFT_269014 [Polyporus arcularius HHB13444]
MGLLEIQNHRGSSNSALSSIKRFHFQAGRAGGGRMIGQSIHRDSVGCALGSYEPRWLLDMPWEPGSWCPRSTMRPASTAGQRFLHQSSVIGDWTNTLRLLAGKITGTEAGMRGQCLEVTRVFRIGSAAAKSSQTTAPRGGINAGVQEWRDVGVR